MTDVLHNDDDDDDYCDDDDDDEERLAIVPTAGVADFVKTGI